MHVGANRIKVRIASWQTSWLAWINCCRVLLNGDPPVFFIKKISIDLSRPVEVTHRSIAGSCILCLGRRNQKAAYKDLESVHPFAFVEIVHGVFSFDYFNETKTIFLHL